MTERSSGGRNEQKMFDRSQDGLFLVEVRKKIFEKLSTVVTVKIREGFCRSILMKKGDNWRPTEAWIAQRGATN